MNIGIVSTWFERGAAYVSKQYMEVLQQEHKVFIYARGGEKYAQGDSNWDFSNVYWSKRNIGYSGNTVFIDKVEFVKWIKKNNIEIILFNEQVWWPPMVWCKELGVKTIGYIDYYTDDTIPFFYIYDYLICNTKKHFSAFKWHPNAMYIPWGTDINIFKPKEKTNNDKLVFFHSAGMNPYRKGTDLLLRSIQLISNNDDFKVLIHTQQELEKFFPDLSELIRSLMEVGKIEVITKTIPAPGLYTEGDIYIYPSRLDGIGLTIAEAISCGLPVIVPNDGPMNEFVEKGLSETVELEKLFCRSDAYYWPMNEIKIEDLANKMLSYINKDKNEIDDLKKQSREYALEHLNWEKNTSAILDIIKNLENCKQEWRDADKLKQTILDINRHDGKAILRKVKTLIYKFPVLRKMNNLLK